MKKEYIVEGMMCNGCVSNIEKQLKKNENIKDYSISLENKTLSLEALDNYNEKELMDSIESIGFDIKVK